MPAPGLGKLQLLAELDQDPARARQSLVPRIGLVRADDPRGDQRHTRPERQQGRARLRGLQAAVVGAAALGEDAEHRALLQREHRPAKRADVARVVLDRDRPGARRDPVHERALVLLPIDDEPDVPGAPHPEDDRVDVARVVRGDDARPRGGHVSRPFDAETKIPARQRGERPQRAVEERCLRSHPPHDNRIAAGGKSLLAPWYHQRGDRIRHS